MANGADLANFTLELVKNVGLVSNKPAGDVRTCLIGQSERTHVGILRPNVLIG